MIARPSPSTAAWTGQHRLEHKCFKVQFFHIYDTSANLFPGTKPLLNIVLVPSRSPSTMSPRRRAAVTLLCYHADEHARLAAAVWQRCSSWQGNGQRWGRVTARCVRTLTYVHTSKLSPQGSAGRSVCARVRVCVKTVLSRRGWQWRDTGEIIMSPKQGWQGAARALQLSVNCHYHRAWYTAWGERDGGTERTKWEEKGRDYRGGHIQN